MLAMSAFRRDVPPMLCGSYGAGFAFMLLGTIWG